VENRFLTKMSRRQIKIVLQYFNSFNPSMFIFKLSSAGGNNAGSSFRSKIIDLAKMRKRANLKKFIKRYFVNAFGKMMHTILNHFQ